MRQPDDAPITPWVDTLGSSRHMDGHKVGLFGGEWWIYPNGWPMVEAQGPFQTREQAKARMDPSNFQNRSTPYLFQVAARFFRVLPEHNPALPAWQREMWREAGRIPRREG